ncbi:30S ribosomal protein S4 [Patescibacteria group bacterium]|nr:MAG: 30S ribosomal protein S4 [Patescibacteria group bacterium]
MPNKAEAKCRLCRREGEKLFLKGSRCNTQKCALTKRNFPPGMHGLVRGGRSDYGKQLRAKQKAKRTYGLRESQFYKYYKEAERLKGVAGDNLLKLLESRLDNVVYRSGLAESRSAARQLVTHGHFLVNKKRVDIPSLQVKPNNEIELRSPSQKLSYFRQVLPFFKKSKPPSWMKIDPLKFRIQIVNELTKENIGESNIDTQAIIEFYSK